MIDSESIHSSQRNLAALCPKSHLLFNLEMRTLLLAAICTILSLPVPLLGQTPPVPLAELLYEKVDLPTRALTLACQFFRTDIFTWSKDPTGLTPTLSPEDMNSLISLLEAEDLKKPAEDTGRAG